MAENLTRQQAFDRILAAKVAQRRKLAELPFQEKILIVLQMQKLSRQLKQAKPSS